MRGLARRKEGGEAAAATRLGEAAAATCLASRPRARSHAPGSPRGSPARRQKEGRRCGRSPRRAAPGAARRAHRQTSLLHRETAQADGQVERWALARPALLARPEWPGTGRTTTCTRRDGPSFRTVRSQVRASGVAGEPCALVCISPSGILVYYVHMLLVLLNPITCSLQLLLTLLT